MAPTAKYMASFVATLVSKSRFHSGMNCVAGLSTQVHRNPFISITYISNRFSQSLN